MLFLNIARCLFGICVPIFIVLSGYLLAKREFNKNHICKLGRIVIVYILCSIVCLLVLHFIENRDVLRLKDYIFQILSFEAAPYSWYVNMYFGLFLLLPFLNVLWNNLKNKKQKQYLLLVLIVIAVLPNTLNIFNFYDLNWWLEPTSSHVYQKLVPDYWGGISYIILYYFLGCYFRDYRLKLSFKKNVVALLVALVIFGLFNFYRSYNALFELGSYSDYGSLEVLVVTILFVNLILNFKFKISNKKAIYFISKISYLTFGAYLVSVIFDRWFYPILKENTSILLERVCYLLLVVPLIFICSLLLSLVIEVIAYLVNKLFRGTLTFIGRKRRHEISFEE